MEIIQNKCPNCGAAISYNSTDKEMICEYCNAHFPISNGKIMVKKTLSSQVYTKRFVKTEWSLLEKLPYIIAAHLTIIIFTFMIFCPLVVSVIKKFDNKKYDEIVEISKLDIQTKKYIFDESLNAIRFDEDSGPKEIFHYGFYFLSSKDEKINMVYDICRKIVYTNNKVIISYVPVLYTNLKVKKDGFYQYEKQEYFSPMKVIEDISEKEIAYYGYDSIEELYDAVIKPQKDSYIIEATEGLYK